MIKVFIARGNAENNGGRTSLRPPVWIVDAFFDGDLLPQGKVKEKCAGCGECVEICPVNVIKMEGDFPAVDKEW